MRTHCSLSKIMIVLLISLPSGAPGQIDSALGYFPLHVSDQRQYQYHYHVLCYNQSYSSYCIEQIIGDTLLPTGFGYKIVQSNLPGEPNLRFLRVDSTTANVYSFVSSPPGERLVDSLRAAPGSVFWREALPTQCISVDTATVLGVRTVVKRFRVATVHNQDYSLAYGFGRIQHITREDDPCYPVLNLFYRDVVYARIDGIEYGTFVDVENRRNYQPSDFELGQNYPNPFNPSTTIGFRVSGSGWVSLKVFDVLGREVTTLVNEEKLPGQYRVTWEAHDIASGVYLYRLIAGSSTETRRLVLVR